MRPRDYFRIGLASVVVLILVIIFFQNASTRVSVVMLGDRSEPMPLSIPVVISYVSGGVIGWLLLGNWWLHDYGSQRKAVRLLERLENRLYDLEERLGRRPEYLLPESLEEQQEFQTRERLSVDDFETDEERDELIEDDDFEDEQDLRPDAEIDDYRDERGWREERRWDY